MSSVKANLQYPTPKDSGAPPSRLASPAVRNESSRLVRQRHANAVRDRLRAATASAHDEVEQVPLVAALMDQGVTRADYLDALERLLGFQEPLAPRLAPWLKDDLLPAHHAALRADLRALGLDEAAIAALPRCQRLPRVATHSSAMGVAWVLHGSALGGVVIHRHLRDRLGAEVMDHAQHFTATPSPVWRRFLGALEQIADPVAAEHAASATFTALRQWLKGSEDEG